MNIKNIGKKMGLTISGLQRNAHYKDNAQMQEEYIILMLQGKRRCVKCKCVRNLEQCFLLLREKGKAPGRSKICIECEPPKNLLAAKYSNIEKLLKSLHHCPSCDTSYPATEDYWLRKGLDGLLFDKCKDCVGKKSKMR